MSSLQPDAMCVCALTYIASIQPFALASSVLLGLSAIYSIANKLKVKVQIDVLDAKKSPSVP